MSEIKPVEVEDVRAGIQEASDRLNEAATSPGQRQEYYAALFAAGSEYFSGVMGQYENLGFEEKEAKAAMAIGLLLRSAVLLSGPPGGNKSRLSRSAWRVFSDIDESEVSLVPTAASLKDIQMVGGTIEVIDGSGKAERRTVRGIFNSSTKYGWVDEGNRVNNFAMNSILDLPETHSLKVVGEPNGYVKVPGFQGMATTMNPSDSEEGLFRMSKAMVARHIAGAIMGRRLSTANRTALRNGSKPDGQVDPLMTTENPRGIYAGIQQYSLGTDENIYLDKLEDAMVRLLKTKYGIVEGGRLTEQLGLMTRTLIVCNNGNTKEFTGIDPSNPIRPAVQAVRFALGSRIGGLVASDDLISEFDESVEEIVSRAAAA